MITEAEKEAMRRESIRLAELDRISELEVAERKGRNNEQIEVIKTMHSNGFDADFISKALSLDLEYVKHVLENN